MVRKAWLSAAAGWLLGCSPYWVELGHTPEGTGGFAGTPGEDAGQGSGSGGAEGGGAGQGNAATSTGGQLVVASCPGLSVEDITVGREGGTCEADDHSTEPTPVDVFIMLDRSSSMSDLLPDGTTRWQGVGEALRSFVEQAANEDLRVGFQYFGQSDGIDDSIDCNVDLYATPKVSIGPIAETGPQILAEIDALLPATQTPTWAALQGAWQYARQWMESGQSSGRPTVVVLVTDGMPTQCEVTSTVEIGWAAQEELLEEPSIRTFVVGAGPYESNYDRIALWGGTDHAFKISDGTASTDLLDALLDITLRGIACEYTIPDSPDSNLLINPKEVRMLYWSDRMAQPDVAEEIPWVRGRDWCGSLHGGWFYDDELAPTKIEVCPCTCARFRQGSVEIQYGCIPLGR